MSLRAHGKGIQESLPEREMDQCAGAGPCPRSPERRANRITRRVRAWLENAERELTLRQCGGDQRCPWCRRWMNGFLGTECEEFDSILDELTCGACGGTSLWKWEVGFFYVCEGEPPPAYDVPSAYQNGEFINGVIREAHTKMAARATGPASQQGNSGRQSTQSDPQEGRSSSTLQVGKGEDS